jgi:acyl-CoA synthetase (AMP-forming)/AMP-acid ligase II/acetyl-CoA acetyltransferase
MDTVFAAFEATAAANATRPFLHDLKRGADISYGQALDRVAFIASSYRARGWRKGNRAALRAASGPELILQFLALNSLGVGLVPLNPDYRKAELDYVLGHSEAALVEGEIPQAPQPVGAGECALLYTSGTTGKPKGCLLSNAYFLGAGRRYLDEGGLCAVREGEDRLITPLPLFHMNALAFSTTAMILSAGCVVQLDRFHPQSWWRDVSRSGATIVHYLGVMPAILLNLPPSEYDRRHKVRFGYGANANPRDHAAFEERFGFPLVEAWAMTETGSGALIAASREPRHVGTRCIGFPPAGLEMQIEPESGELLVRQAGPDPRKGFFSGYLKDEAATAEAWRDGWFHTGDAVRRGEDGALHFVDRRKNIIRRSGENIAALEVESALADHPAVKQVAVIAVPDEVRDEEVMACVVLVEHTVPNLDTVCSIQDWCLERLAYFKAPGYVALVDSLPVTATNKVQKAKLAEFTIDPVRRFDLRERKKRRPAAPRKRMGYEGVVVAAPVTVPYARYSIRSAHWWLARALSGLLKASGLKKTDIDGMTVSSFTLAPDTAIGLTQHLGVSPRWLDHVPLGGASGVVALRRAARAVQSGDAEVVACLAGDTNHVDSFRLTLANFSQFARDAVYPYGAGGPNASFAFLTGHYMRTTGTKREDFGKLCVAQRANALKNPQALFKKPLSLEEYLGARPIAEPLHLFDCVMPCAGAEAFLVLSEEKAKALGIPAAKVLGTIERHNAFAEDPIQMRGGWALERDELYAQAGAGPRDMDFLQAYDDYPVISLMQIEDLGFCGKGEGASFIRAQTFTHDGSFPLNTSGGQLSVGQAGAAGGFLGMTEAIRQLTGQAGSRQVRDARLGLVSGFGMINFDRGLGSGAVVLGA